MLPEHRISGILNASARDRNTRISEMIEDVAQSENPEHDWREYVGETVRNWQHGTVRTRDPAKSLLQSMTKIWPQHAQGIVAYMLNNAHGKGVGESFYRSDIAENICRILERQEKAGEELSLEILVSETNKSEHGKLVTALNEIRNSYQNISPTVRDGVSMTLVEHLGQDKPDSEIVPLFPDEGSCHP